MVVYARIDPKFAKDQLTLFLQDNYMSVDGQIPAHEFQFSDLNPPVHAWAVWCVYKMAAPKGLRDIKFLKAAFTKLVYNFKWYFNCCAMEKQV